MFLEEKYSSRKFWCAVINAIVNLIVLVITDNPAIKMAALAFITMGFVVFMICEAVIDCASLDSLTVHIHHKEKNNKNKEDDDMTIKDKEKGP